MHRNSENQVFFGPYRALLRAFQLKNHKAAEALLTRFGMDSNRLLVRDAYVARAFFEDFCLEVEQFTNLEPLFALEASQLFQLSDLGEPGWLLRSVRNLQQAKEVLELGLPRVQVNLDDENGILCLWQPADLEPVLFVDYKVSVALSILTGQGFPKNLLAHITLPEFHRPKTATKLEHWLHLFFLLHQLTPSFSGKSVALRMHKNALNFSFPSSDATLFNFFWKRFESSLKSDRHQKQETLLTSKREQVSSLLKANLSSPEYSAHDAANTIGISVRTLERVLAKEGTSFRELKQDLQYEVAKEMLAMGMRAKEVAIAVGFEDLSAFSRAYSKWAGCSPSKARGTNNERQQKQQQTSKK